NRLTGANNWNNLATWIQQRSGVITLTNGSATITGASTNFQAELAVGNNIMLLNSPGTVYTVATIDPVLQSITVAPVPAVSTSGGYGRQYIPGINPPASDVDAVVIGNTNLADAATTITLDTDAQILTLTIGSTTRTTAQVLTHQNSTRDLVVLANATVSQPGGAATNTWNINDGTADVQGDVTIGSAASNVNTRVSRINITTGTLGAGSLRFRPFIQAGREVQTVLNISGAGTVNLHGALTFNGNRGTLSSAAGSTFNFDRSASGQTIAIPTSSAAAWVYANIHANNTSSAGVAFGFTSTATSVTGNVRVQTGLMTLGNFDLVGAAGSTFEVANGATFEMRSTTGGGTGGFPTGFGTVSLGASSTVAYNQIGNTNPWSVLTHTYGNLIIGQNGSTRNFQIANATTNVAGNLTVGSGTSTPTFRATGTATLNVTGNVTINSSASLDGSNITNFNVGGNWTNDGDFTEGTNTVTFNSPAANVLQLLGGTVSETFYNLRLNTSAATDAVRLTNSITVLNNLVLTQGGLELNGNTLSVGNSATTAISRTTGYIKSESTTAPYGTIRWFINNGTGTYTYPFGVSSTQYIPFVMNITVAGTKGVGSGYVPVSTYATAATNPPGEYPTGVTNLNGTTGGASVTDRYWNITLGSSEFAGTRPTSTITFTALNTEKPSTWTAIGEPPTNPNQLLTQRWNTAAYWDPAQTSPAQSYTNNAPAAGTFQVNVPSVSSYSTSWTITDSSVPLPVELVAFSAMLRDDQVEVTWTTESETNNDFFTVQRTADGEQFEDIAQVKGKGTTVATHDYRVVDNLPRPGRWYYRVRQTDYDGTHSYSRLAAVDVPESLFRTVFPNPGNGREINLALPAGDLGKVAVVVLTDVQGRTVYQSVPFGIETNSIRLELNEAVTAGIYLVSLAVDSEVRRYKWIVR
ncbi:MAG: T9SS type A sorting domain-containing protein, partial [Cyclobacteriaceae bacterium]|nr:T9SS type A sorting domain-containing protein [Cyclobacteriaceae bacterium]